MSVLQTLLQIPRLRLSPPPTTTSWPLILFSNLFLSSNPQIFLFISSSNVTVVSQSIPVGTHPAVPTNTSAADGGATQHRHQTANTHTFKNTIDAESEPVCTWSADSLQSPKFKTWQNFYDHLSTVLVRWAIMLYCIRNARPPLAFI